MVAQKRQAFYSHNKRCSMNVIFPQEMQELNQNISVCRKCALAATRANAVLGVGSLDAYDATKKPILPRDFTVFHRRLLGVLCAKHNCCP